MMISRRAARCRFGAKQRDGRRLGPHLLTKQCGYVISPYLVLKGACLHGRSRGHGGGLSVGVSRCHRRPRGKRMTYRSWQVRTFVLSAVT
eukprot:9341762-Pyramimonas_sp.AAC.1